jgi:hypothetical protein
MYYRKALDDLFDKGIVDSRHAKALVLASFNKQDVYCHIAPLVRALNELRSSGHGFTLFGPNRQEETSSTEDNLPNSPDSVILCIDQSQSKHNLLLALVQSRETDEEAQGRRFTKTISGDKHEVTQHMQRMNHRPQPESSDIIEDNHYPHFASSGTRRKVGGPSPAPAAPEGAQNQPKSNAITQGQQSGASDQDDPMEGMEATSSLLE